MQVFSLYFKVLRKYIGQIFMYIGIFSGVLIGVIVPQMTNEEENNFVKFKNDFAVFDYDDSKLSNALTDYLAEKHNLTSIKEDSEEKIQDELYEQSVHSVIRFEDGFQDSFANGELNTLPEVYAIPDSKFYILFEQDVNAFLSVINTYLNAGFEMSDAIDKTIEATNESIEIEMMASEEETKVGPLHYFFKYLSWVFIAACVGSVTTALISINKKGIKERIECSSYKFFRVNMEILAGVIVTGLAICALFAIMAVLAFSKDMLTLRGVLYVINSMCVMAVALSITFLISKLTANLQVISLLSNVISLGMAFLCGVFVPMEFLSDVVIKIAHFLPAYWNVRAIEVIDSYKSGDFGSLLTYMGIQILFAVIICCVGFFIAGRKRQNQ